MIAPLSAPTAEGLSHVYATIKPPVDPEPAGEAAADEAASAPAESEMAETEATVEATAEAPAPPAAGDGGLANVYATLKPPGGLDVETTGSVARAQPAFATQVERGAIWVRARTPTRCLPGDLTEVVAEVAERFGEVRIMSTHRTRAHNRRAGGARRSMHLSCRAIDFRVAGRSRAVMAYLRDHPAVGGLKRYRSGLIHIDNGDRRSW
ncbi:YcbK family protein [Salinarimonas rosea]|uniref:YcbK family protein n=1 Tax=Salinarimonas rosea TaxID=552063 RepID=UPI0004180B75|nr:D-Ala-D-Ala carboxypeptidase family metallohydrolase [Salinarimonas rosea]